MYFDSHSDIWCDITQQLELGNTDIFNKRHLEKFRKGGIEGSFFVIWVDPPHDADYALRTHQIMDSIRTEMKTCDAISFAQSLQLAVLLVSTLTIAS